MPFRERKEDTLNIQRVQMNKSQIVRPAFSLFFLLALLTGVVYPVAITALSQVIFPYQANGSKIIRNGTLVGSELIGQPFSDPIYFWGRLSATPDFPYNANFSSGSNFGPSDPRLNATVQARIAALIAVDPDNTQPIPIDLITFSGSGLDPEISVAAAQYQAPRIARVRHLEETTVMDLISNHSIPPQLGIFGEPRVNVLNLNLALDGFPEPSSNSLQSNPMSGVFPMDWMVLIAFFGCLFLLIYPLGKLIHKFHSREQITRFEQRILKISNVCSEEEMNWKTYMASMLLFNGIGIWFLFTLCELQGYLPLNPNEVESLSPDLAFNVAVSFVTNTNWQSYAGEAQLSYLTQMLGLTVQNFLSAATGISILMAFIRGLVRKTTTKLGNFWTDILKSTEILLVLSSILAIFLVSQGCVQTLDASFPVTTLEPIYNSAAEIVPQSIQVGPVASQVAIKILGSNGGGFFNVNGAHPFENPSPLTNFVETLMELAIPGALCVTYGKMAKDKHEGLTLLVAMLVLFVAFLALTIWAEFQSTPLFTSLNVNTSWGNMEGKEVRFGAILSALYATTTTATSNGSVNAMMESFTPIGIIGPLLLMQMGEIAFGGVGSGIYGMLVFVLVANFIAGLMVGRTPEYLGKKLTPKEMKLVAIIILVPNVTILIGSAIAVLVPSAIHSIYGSGPHGFIEIIYAFTSAVNNNGSAYAGLNANIPFFNIGLGIAMLIGRFAVAWLILALAGSLVERKRTPPSAGMLKTYSLLYVCWLLGVIVIIGVLCFIPVLILGPIVEALL